MAWINAVINVITSSFVVTFCQTVKKVGMEDLGAKVRG